MLGGNKMKLVRRPREHLTHALLVWLGIPIFWLNIWILERVPFQSFFKGHRLTWSIVEAIWIAITFRWVVNAKWTGFWSLWLLNTVLLWGNVYFLIRTKNYALAFYAMFLLTISIMYFTSLYRNLKEPFYSSGRTWYEGLPHFLPNIVAELRASDDADTFVEGRLSRLGNQGFFVFPVKGSAAFGKTGKVRLKLKEERVECPVELVCMTGDGAGGGFRFQSTSADAQKEIGDFIERARSLGYVR